MISLDTAFKTGKSSDYSAATVWGQAPSGLFLLAAWRGRVEFPALKAKTLALFDQWKPNAVLIEDKASGMSLVQELQSGTSLPVIPVKVDADKIMRATAVSPMFESGRVFVPMSSAAPWLEDVLDELLAFPGGVHDDYVDTVSQALNYLRGKRSVEMEWLERGGFSGVRAPEPAPAAAPQSRTGFQSSSGTPPPPADTPPQEAEPPEPSEPSTPWQRRRPWGR